MPFTDLMTSDRGPWVAGILMALIIAIGFGVLFMFGYDEDLQGGDQPIESVISRQADTLDSYKSLVAEVDKKLGALPQLEADKKELARVNRELQNRESRIDGLKQGIADANAAIAELEESFESYKGEYRALVRGRAKGREIARLETRGGKVFENVSVRNVSAVGLLIRYDGGLARIPFEELSDEIQEEFQFDADEKAAAIAREREQREAHEAAVSAASKEEDERRQQNADVKREQTMRAIAAKEAQIGSLQREIESLERAIRLERRKAVSRASQLEKTLASKKRQLASLQAQVAILRQQL